LLLGILLTLLIAAAVWGCFSHPRFNPRLQFVQVPDDGDVRGYPGVTLRLVASGRLWYRPEQAFICAEGDMLAVRGARRGVPVARLIAMKGGATRIETTSDKLWKRLPGEWVMVGRSESLELNVSYAAIAGKELRFQT